MLTEIILGTIAIASIVSNYFVVRELLAFKMKTQLLEKSSNTFEAIAAMESMKQIENPEEEEDIHKKGEEETPALRGI